MEEALKKRVSREGLSGSVRLLGYRTDVPRLLNRADVFVLASQREGLPRVVMEAMACARPVVATDVRGSRDLVRDGENGLLVPPGRPDLLAEVLLRLLGDRELAGRMGAAGEGVRPGVCSAPGAPGDGRHLPPFFMKITA